MRRQPDRDEQTVTIATTIALFVVVLFCGLAIFALLEWAMELSGGFQRAFFTGVFLVAALISLGYLLRQRRP